MFDVKPYKPFKNLHSIVDNKHVFFNDGDNDIFYTGTNSWGNRIIGSIVFEEDEAGYLRYFHVMVTDNQFNNFINRRISLRNILKETDGFFVVDMNYLQEELDYNFVGFNDIPNEFLPLENSICPKFITDATLDYVFSLKGALADIHLAFSEIMSKLNNTLYTFLKKTSSFINELEIIPKVFSKPAMTGSFELQFKIVFESPMQTGLFFKPTEDINTFLFDFFKYIFEKLPNERPNFLKEDNIVSDDFKKLEEAYSKIYSERGMAVIENAKDQKIIDLITYSVDNFKDIEYTGFESIEMINMANDGSLIPMALISQSFYDSVEDKIFKPEELDKEAIIIVDETIQKYSIQVYSLNNESGNGWAYFITENKGVIRLSLHLRGKQDYHDTVYAKNVAEANPIEIMGIGKKINGVLKQITVNF